MAEYFNPGESRSLFNFTTSLQNLLEKKNYHSRDIILVCIGSDRATGDCLGPIVGHKLARFCNTHKNSLHLFGTLEQPIHAKNLEATLQFIHSCYKNALIIAIDASLGVVEHVGYITLGEGDIFITGIVNLSGFGSQMLLQTTHLNLVMQLADFISLGLFRCLMHSQFRSSLKCAE